MKSEKTTGLSMLDKLASGIMDDKATKGARLAPALTPVTGELRTPAAFPNDMPIEVVSQALIDLDRIIRHLTEARDAMALLAGKPTVAPEPEADSVKAAEREADGRVNAKREAVMAAMMAAGDGDENPIAAMVAAADEASESFDARMKRLGDEAKAATFSSPTAPAATGNGWSCPQHGDTNLTVKTSPRRGVQFTKCAVADCHEFERV